MKKREFAQWHNGRTSGAKAVIFPTLSARNDGKDGAPRTKPTSLCRGGSHFMQIEKPIYGGAFLARVEGKAMFVPLALPGRAGARARRGRKARLRNG
jgi:hypothetical protein